MINQEEYEIERSIVQEIVEGAGYFFNENHCTISCRGEEFNFYFDTDTHNLSLRLSLIRLEITIIIGVTPIWDCSIIDPQCIEKTIKILKNREILNLISRANSLVFWVP